MSSNIKLNRICEECEKLFVARTTVTRFCSRSCNGKNLKRKIKQLKIEASDRRTKMITDAPVRLISEMEYLTLSNTSKLLNVSRTTLWRMIKQSQINTYNIGGKTIIKKVELDSLFKNL